MTLHTSLENFLSDYTGRHSDVDPDLVQVMKGLGDAFVKIADIVHQGRLRKAVDRKGGETNVHGEVQQDMDIKANQVMIDCCQSMGVFSALASEEMEHHCPVEAQDSSKKYMLVFDPLDGSSNIDVNVSVGTIFSVLKAPDGQEPADENFLQKGRQQVAAGYALYGPQTMVVFTLGDGVVGFTLNPQDNSWVLTHENLQIPEDTKEFAINMSNARHWAKPVSRYITECLQGEEGPRGKNFNMRWIASMVADVHRVLMRGGVFMYPWDKRKPEKPGKLRLLYEANPMSMLIEQAGGAAYNGKQDILDAQPQSLHETVSVMLGAKNEIALLRRYHEEMAE